MLNGSKHRGAICKWGVFLALSTTARTQSLPTSLDLPNTTVTSGTVARSATNSITAASGFNISGSASVTFKAGSRISLEPGFHATAGSASPAFHALIGTPTFPITITTAPSIGLSLTVDGAGCTSPCTFQWTAGSAHTIATTATQSGGAGTQYVFANWSDAGASSHTINVANETYTANFTQQYYLTTSATWGYLANHPETEGTISPASGWYNSGAVVPVTAAPSSGYQFGGFGGNLIGSTNPQNLTMTGPMSVTATFGIASLTSNPMSGPGPTQFVIRLGTPPGGTALNGQMLMNWGFSGVNGCYIMYQLQSNALTLLNDAATSWTGFQAPGSGGTIANSQCTLDFGASSVTNNAGALVVTLSVTFKPAFVGTRILYAYDQFSDPASGGAWNSEWETIGTYLAYQGTQITFNPPNASLGQTGGLGTTSFSNSGNWTAAISDPWIHLNSPASGSNGGTLSFSADANPTQDLRYGNIAVNGSQFWIYVSELIVNLNPTSADNVPASGGSGSFDVITSSNWTASTTASWIHLSGTTSGYGLGTVIYTVDPNTGGTRTDVISVAGQATFRITQNGVLVPCTITTVPPGLLVSVDGAPAAPSPQTFQWPSAQQHTITVTTPQGGVSGTQYVFSSWSDGGALQHSILVPSSATTWTATFTTQYLLTTAVSPSAGGAISPGSSWHNSGDGVQVTATATSPYVFSNFSGALNGTTNPQALTMNGPATVTANFIQVAQTTISTTPNALALTVDGTPCTAPCTYPANVSHTVSFTGTQDGPSGTRYVFTAWADGNTDNPRTIPSSSGATYTVQFKTQYQLTTSASPTNGGTVVVAPVVTGAWYDSGAPITITATPNSGFQFTVFTGSLGGSTNPQSLTINAPATVIATFALNNAITIKTSATLPSLAPNMPYSPPLQLVADGGVGTYTWLLMPGSTLSPDLALSTSGVISGAVKQSGSYTFTVKVTDSLSQSATLTLSLTVSKGIKEYIRFGGRVIAIETQ